MKMPYGKYGPKNFPPKGADIAFINSGYLKWLNNEDWFIEKGGQLLHAVEEELQIRTKNDLHFYQDKIS